MDLRYIVLLILNDEKWIQLSFKLRDDYRHKMLIAVKTMTNFHSQNFIDLMTIWNFKLTKYNPGI